MGRKAAFICQLEQDNRGMKTIIYKFQDMTIAIIVWAILIIFIAEAASPGLIWMTLGCMAVYGILYFGVVWLVNWIKTRHKR